MKKQLFILGNGFDLHHGMATSFLEFSKFVQSERPDIADLFLIYLADNNEDQSIELWADFESALSKISVKESFTLANEILDESDAFNPSAAEFALNEATEGLGISLMGLFENWVEQIEIPSILETENRMLRFPENSLFINFNYTNTLNELYQINEKNILHIHGSTKESSPIIVGHGVTAIAKAQHFFEVSDQWGNELDPATEGFYSSETSGIVSTLKHYFQKTLKPVSEIIERQKKWFYSCRNVTDIYVLGHSLSDVDLPYFQEIRRTTTSVAPKWHFSYFDDEDYKRVEEIIRRLVIPGNSVGNIKLLSDYVGVLE